VPVEQRAPRGEALPFSVVVLLIPRRPRAEPLPGDERQHLRFCLADSTLLPLTARAAAAIEAVEVEPSDPQWAYIGGQTGQTPP
jgi:hypothetical protein